MFGEKFQRKYALTDQGVRNTKKGTFWTVIVNLVVMGGVSILYLVMSGFMGILTEGSPLPGSVLVIGALVLFILLSFVTHLQQYKATYGLVYNEIKTTRLSLAERLRKLPLGYFGKRDLADLTETIMGDVNRMEHVWSHVLGYLYGAYISTAIIAVCLFVYDWRLAIACLWGVPVAFGLLFGSRKIAACNAERTKKAAVRVSDGIQEALENVREIRATNQEERYLNGLNQKIDEHERVTIQGELGTGLFVNAASVIMRLGVATTILVGANLILSGSIDFMLLFLFLLVITRVYAPFDQSLALIAEMFVSQVSADRMNALCFLIQVSLVSRTTSLCHTQELILHALCSFDVDLGRQVALGVYFVIHIQGSVLRIAQVFFRIGFINTQRKRFFVAVAGPYLLSLFAMDDSRSGILTERKYTFSSNFCITQESQRHIFIVITCFRIAQDLSHLLVVRAAKHKGYITESGIGHCRKTFFRYFQNRSSFELGNRNIIFCKQIILCCIRAQWELEPDT